MRSFKTYSVTLKGKIFLLLFLMAMLSACKKFVAVDEVRDSLLAEQVFESDATANSAIAGLYRTMRGAVLTPFIQLNSIYSNEIVPYSNALSNTYYTFNLQPADAGLPWNNFYAVIYGANNSLEKLAASTHIPESRRKIYMAEAKFMRALNHFYMVNLYGDVPLVLTTDINTNRQISRSTVASVYAQIIADLKDAKASLPDDYSHVTGGERARANKWAASALLARVYLYQKDYTNAEAEANAVLNSGKYSLLNSAAGIFNKNNNEAIFQFTNNSTESIPVSAFIYGTTPIYVCAPVLLSAFESGDARKSTWVRTTTYAGQPVSVPFKFTTTAANPPEYITMIRLGEVQLIRAEARAMRNDFQGCADDVNLLRLRHGGLSVPLPAPADQTAAITMLLHERLVDLFTEGCHRFFDLNRTGRINAVMQLERPAYWKTTAALYPIPLDEVQRNPNMTQNPGYN